MCDNGIDITKIDRASRAKPGSDVRERGKTPDSVFSL